MTVQSEQEPPLSLFAKLPKNYSYAAWQNSIPLLRALTVRNVSSDSFDNLKVELSSDPPFLRRKTWKLARVVAGDKIAVEDRNVDLDVGYLSGLNEAERCQIRLSIVDGDHVINESAVEIEESLLSIMFSYLQHQIDLWMKHPFHQVAIHLLLEAAKSGSSVVQYQVANSLQKFTFTS